MLWSVTFPVMLSAPAAVPVPGAMVPALVSVRLAGMAAVPTTSFPLPPSRPEPPMLTPLGAVIVPVLCSVSWETLAPEPLMARLRTVVGTIGPVMVRAAAGSMTTSCTDAGRMPSVQAERVAHAPLMPLRMCRVGVKSWMLVVPLASVAR